MVRRIPLLARFGCVGGFCAALQLGLLGLLVTAGLPHALANVAALLLSTQLNFGLSQSVTWADRTAASDGRTGLAQRWARFHAMVAVSLLLNQLTFQMAEAHLHYLPAAALGIAVGGIVNFALSDRLVFPSAAGTLAPITVGDRPPEGTYADRARSGGRRR
jgi:putative flippase GtrA